MCFNHAVHINENDSLTFRLQCYEHGVPLSSEYIPYSCMLSVISKAKKRDYNIVFHDDSEAIYNKLKSNIDSFQLELPFYYE